MSTLPTSGPAAGARPSKKKQAQRPRHVPQRTCIACRTTAPKRAFVRLVRTPTGEVVIDPTGKKSGRGASVCGTRACWTKALAGSLIDRALRVQVQDEDRAALRAFLTSLPDDEATGDGAPEASAPGQSPVR